MSKQVPDTSKTYEDLVGYKAPETTKTTLLEFLDDQEEQDEEEIRRPPSDPDYPEKWQNLYVNFNCFEDYVSFMNMIGEMPVPNLKTLVYRKEKDDGILKFLDD